MKKFLFLVDDDPDEFFFFREAIAEINPDYECFTCSDGQEALQQLIQEKIKPNFIFLDLMMPRMDGKDFLRQIKKIPRLSQIPVIIYTDSKYRNDIEESLKLGAFSVVIKPFGIDGIVASIKKIIE